MKISSSRLTTCGILQDGQTVRFDFVDQGGVPVSVQFPLDQMAALVMTIPRLLAEAAKVQTGDRAALYVFPLGDWSIGSNSERGCLVLTLSTPDGFAVTFSLPCDDGLALARDLAEEAERTGTAKPGDGGAASPRRLN